MKRAKQSPSRNRKVSCPDCGYTVRTARSWMDRGLPVCPCGSGMRPDAPADLAYCGLIGQDDMPAVQWTSICRENGWEDSIMRRGAAAKSWTARREQLRGDPAEHCVYPGCGRWIAEGAERCGAGHAQHEDAPALEAIPF
jgi:hypothetical protein